MSGPIVITGSWVGDYALFFRKAAVEICYDNEKYLVVPQADPIEAILEKPADDAP